MVHLPKGSSLRKLWDHMLSKTFVDEMKALLVKEQERLERDLGDIAQKDPKKPGVYHTNFEETGNSDDDNAMEITAFADEQELTNNLQEELEDVVSALKAIEKGKYGVCKYCGTEIDEKRLQARPTSSSCVACKKALTQEM